VHDLLQLVKDVEIIKQRASEYKGQCIAIMNSIESEFGCKTIEEAEKKFNELEKEETKRTEEFNKKIEQFKDEFKELLCQI